MSLTVVLAIAFAIGVVAGLRSMTAPAVVSWAAHLKWLNLQNSHLAFLGSTIAVIVLTVAAVGELIADKLPKTPSRKAPLGLIARLVTGGFSGFAVCVAANQSLVIGALLGGVGGIVGAFAGYEARTRLVKALGTPDYMVAILEDAVAIVVGFFLVSRF
jgi:uncharacterized membrane protein